MDAHPTDLELAEFVDGTATESGDTVASHVASCPLCRVRVDGSSSLDFEQERASSATFGGEVPSFVREVFASAKMGNVRPGEIWRVEAKLLAGLVLVLGQDSDTVLVAPVTFDAEMADEYTILVEGSCSPLEVPLAIWAGARTVVPRAVLDRRVTTVDLVVDVSRVHKAFREGAPVTDLSVGLPIVSDSDPRWAYRQHLLATFAMLGSKLDVSQPLEDVSAIPLARGRSEQIQAELELLDEIQVFDDPFRRLLVAPLASICLVRYWDVTTRVCLLSGVDTFDSISKERLTEIVDVATVLRDADFVTLVTDSEELDAVVHASADLHPAYLAPQGFRSTPRWLSTTPLPLLDAMRWWIERLGQSDASPLIDALEIESLPLEEIAASCAAQALTKLRKSSTKNDFRIEAIHSLNASDDAALTELVVCGFRSGATEIEGLLEKMTEPAA